MVRALLDGRKTQTRRIVKNPDYYGCLTGDCPHTLQEECNQALTEASPYGQPGDRLWVRETHRINGTMGGPRVTYRADNAERFPKAPDTSSAWIADDNHWRPSIFMPHWASRITLELTGVRVECLRDISEEDALAEGVEPYTPGPTGMARGEPQEMPSAAYRTLWEQINGAGSWDKNPPWVWVLTFRRLP